MIEIETQLINLTSVSERIEDSAVIVHEYLTLTSAILRLKWRSESTLIVVIISIEENFKHSKFRHVV